MKVAIESPAEQSNSHLEEVVGIWNRKSSRIAVEVNLQYMYTCIVIVHVYVYILAIFLKLYIINFCATLCDAIKIINIYLKSKVGVRTHFPPLMKPC